MKDPIKDNIGQINTKGTSSSKGSTSDTSKEQSIPITQKVTEKVQNTAQKLKETVSSTLHQASDKLHDLTGTSKKK